ncbi:FKBP-type peptidyl-prolyl cis-trans isomerase [Thalassotalea eurytherma]|uniref:Peptidyl-prolyl cis-trans isomerase n=1 Tax=Thalassotalea eurytherma TaxID=1144278 RepID=A0ABQ6H5H4_9GAMM|nr:FKBP-type peptidyl-prolyl cis-trans isomerase [Thalassotalea eurytherma]GLX83382.1 peptidyl-prolyl cis-trans isomerase [Thalassotalea eurytherma]
MKFIVVILLVVIAYVAFQRSTNNKELVEENQRLATAFLNKNVTEEGVIETASGLQYKVLQKGDGEQHPTATDKVQVHYHGTLLNGTVFDSSVDRGEPISFGLNQVISGWTEGVQKMVVGDKVRLFIPAKLAYGNKGAGKVTPGSLLIFDVELLAIH